MTPEREAELFQKLDFIVAKVVSLDNRMAAVEGRLTAVEDRLTAVEDRLTAVEDRLSAVERRLDLIEGRLGTIDGDIRELKGQQTIMLAWLQSMDQRFGAIMAPVAPPKKPAA
jgi:chromosome segregation ATPase